METAHDWLKQQRSCFLFEFSGKQKILDKLFRINLTKKLSVNVNIRISWLKYLLAKKKKEKKKKPKLVCNKFAVENECINSANGYLDKIFFFLQYVVVVDSSRNKTTLIIKYVRDHGAQYDSFKLGFLTCEWKLKLNNAENVARKMDLEIFKMITISYFKFLWSDFCLDLLFFIVKVWSNNFSSRKAQKFKHWIDKVDFSISIKFPLQVLEIKFQGTFWSILKKISFIRCFNC